MKPHTSLRSYPWKQAQKTLQIMGDRWLDRLGNWNPQLLREIKGNCTQRNLILVSLAAIATQVIFWIFWQNIAAETATVRSGSEPVYRFYCTGLRDGVERVLCERISATAFAVNWPLWWLDLFFGLSAILLGLLVLVGTQALINNWAQESKQGTLAFIRMTPESSDRILLGKLLGAPALIHWAVLLALPLHTLAGLQGGLGLGGLLLVDGVAVALITTFYLLALFYASTIQSKQGVSGWAFGLLGLFFYFPVLGVARAPMFLVLPLGSAPQLNWFGQNVIAQPELLAGMAIAVLSSLSIALWQSLTRRFDQPDSTFSTKAQSYWLTLGFNLFAIGFFVPWRQDQIHPWGVVGLAWGMVMTVWMALLLPPRQTLLDWARYRHLHKSQDVRSGRSALKDWLWGDNSPSFLALLVNGAITIALWLPWALAFHGPTGVLVLLSIGCATLLMLLYAALVQWVLLWNVRQPIAWAVGLLGIVMIGSIALGVGLGLQDSANFWGWFWLMTPLASLLPSLISEVGNPIALGAAGLAFAINGLAAIAMFCVAMNQLDRLGLSESAALMRGDRLEP